MKNYKNVIKNFVFILFFYNSSVRFSDFVKYRYEKNIFDSIYDSVNQNKQVDLFLNCKFRSFFYDPFNNIQLLRQDIATICNYNYDPLEKLYLIFEIFNKLENELRIQGILVGNDEKPHLIYIFLNRSGVFNRVTNFDFIFEFVPVEFYPPNIKILNLLKPLDFKIPQELNHPLNHKTYGKLTIYKKVQIKSIHKECLIYLKKFFPDFFQYIQYSFNNKTSLRFCIYQDEPINPENVFVSIPKCRIFEFVFVEKSDEPFDETFSLTKFPFKTALSENDFKAKLTNIKFSFSS